ncbi:hypothetical protein HPT27_14880 [Permianibacter sp. IMCC34836]|uniref:baseplate J/gp47 family protein n=1 Tax=Permianibacter fluminis TaxID=2738515 RepID=UPI0015557F1B|nr:baseplate J/gp47 family protein [Permianibacter fluminis]NQD38310.1 hypothetical protein [Permianibacter fluminis]
MAEQSIIDRQIFEPGQSQDERLPAELDVHHADADERSPEDLYRFLQRLAPHIRYYRTDPNVADGDWSSFFAANEATIRQWLQQQDGDAPAHLGLLLSFLKLYGQPQALLNQLTGRHLAFFYRDILQFAAKPARPDEVHVLLELKKQNAKERPEPVLIGPAQVFSAGKDASNVERLYVPTGDTVINRSRVARLQSIFRDDRGHGSIRFAAVANSADGFGSELPEQEPKWPAFGHVALPVGKIGFAVASPVLRMAEGQRHIDVLLTLAGLPANKPSSAVLGNAFELHLTADKRWLGPLAYSASFVSGSVLKLAIDLTSTDPAVIDYRAEVHGNSFAATAPLLQVLLKPASSNVGYEDLAALQVQRIQVAVQVTGISTLALDGDAGKLDPKKAFMPFGPQPVVGTRFVVGCPEAFSKKLSQLQLTLQWKGAPQSFSAHYHDYNVSGVNNGRFTCAASFHDGGSWDASQNDVDLFGNDGRTETTMTFRPGSPSTTSSPSAADSVYALSNAGTFWAGQYVMTSLWLNATLQSYTAAPPAVQPGSLVLALEHDFLHAQYRTRTIEEAYKSGNKVVLNEPYAPTLQYLKLSYQANTDDVAIDSNSLAAYSHPDVQFFHVGCFGTLREHRYQREQLSFVSTKQVPLLPAFPYQGEFLIGIADAQAGDSVSLLFQVAEGSADPELPRQPIDWHVLCDNYWKPLASSELVLDTSNALLTSGIVRVVLPAGATYQNSWLATDHIWLRAAVREQVSAVSELLQVASNAVTVQFADQGNDPAHLLTALPAKQIVKLKTPVAGIKSVTQPFASFGGRAEESDPALHRRAAERLRHKQRAITAWDHERLVLEQFPSVHRVKCIPHAKPGAWLAPGNLLVIVVPDLRQRNGRDPLQPKVDANTLAEIQAYLQQHSAMQINLQVRNPRYQKLRLDFAVQFRTGYEFNFYSGQLNQALLSLLSPWAFDASRPLQFGGRVYKSVLLDFVEELPYVDYVSDFKLFSWAGETPALTDRNEVFPESPDSILVSDASHHIVGMG